MVLRPLAVLAVVLLCAQVPLASGQASEGPPPTLFVGDPAPPLEVSTWVKGTKIDQLDPAKTYVIGFWSSWSAPSKAVMPRHSELALKHRSNGVECLGIFVKENVEGQVAALVTEMGDRLGFAVAIDAPKKIPPGSMELPEGKPGQMAQSWLVAAGRDNVLTAFVVHKGRVAWIGHPHKIDDPLAAIAAGTFDLAVAAKAYRERATLDAQRHAVVVKVRPHFQAKEYDKAVAVIDEAVAATPALETVLGADKFTLLLAKGDHATASAYGTKVVDGCLKDDAVMLNQIAWTIVDPRSTVDRGMRNLALARKAAERAVELTKADDWAILDTLALVCFDQGEAERALELQDKAVKLAVAAGAGDEDPTMKSRLEQFRSAVAAKKPGG